MSRVRRSGGPTGRNRPLLAAFLLCTGLACGPGAGTDTEPTAGGPGAASGTRVEGLGTIHLPTSGTGEAERHFLRGVLLLHSFEYGPARAAFDSAQALAADYAMAYWGEAMTHNHPLWREQDREAARRALRELGSTREERRAKAPTDREKAYLETVEILYGDGPKPRRDTLYSRALADMVERFPGDVEARAFHALSLLGLSQGERHEPTYMEAGARALRLFRDHPDHPGAAHYAIHSFDDPTHAPLGLDAARAYADIAPRAAHARHMTSHIFLALGHWDEVVEANEAAARSTARARGYDGSDLYPCGHYAEWLSYGYLQRGQIPAARELILACHEMVGGGPEAGSPGSVARMRAHYLVDASAPDVLAAGGSDAPDAAAGAGEVARLAPDLDRMSPARQMARDFGDGLAAASRGDPAGVRAAAERVARRADGLSGRRGNELRARSRILALALGAMAARSARELPTALDLARQAARLEEELPVPFGPPASFKPPRELEGEILLAMDRPADAVRAYRHALERTPRRPRSLAGLARAAELAGDGELTARTRADLRSIRPSPDASYDVLLRGGTVYDGSGGDPYVADVAIEGDTIAAIGDLGESAATEVLDVSGLAVAPGFVNMLSWGFDDLLHDGRGLSDVRQGVTLEVFGEGFSPGPLTDAMAREVEEEQGDLKYDVTWRTFDGALDTLVRRGASPNVASFVGATSVRQYVMGHDARAPTGPELDRMQELVREAMRQGALGVGSSLIYEPAFHATTDELVALAAAGEHDGMYISHMRSEGNRLLESLSELMEISRRADVPAEVYHFKASGRRNWPRLDSAIAMIDSARAAGRRITADIYTYPASATGLDAAMPSWVQEGGTDAWVRRLQDSENRERVARQMADPEAGLGYTSAGTPENILLVDFQTDSLEYLEGKTLAEVAELRGQDPRYVAMDLVVQDHSRIGAIYFTMSEENLRKKLSLPWVSFCSDASAVAPEDVFLEWMPHPRAYGSFARVIGKFRREGVITLPDAVRRLSALPAENLGLEGRGELEPGAFADVVVFDPERVRDHATFQEPHQLATGVLHVFVNGVQVLRDQEHTGATPGRFVRGPGWEPEEGSVTGRRADGGRY